MKNWRQNLSYSECLSCIITVFFLTHVLIYCYNVFYFGVFWVSVIYIEAENLFHILKEQESITVFHIATIIIGDAVWVNIPPFNVMKFIFSFKVFTVGGNPMYISKSNLPTVVANSRKG